MKRSALLLLVVTTLWLAACASAPTPQPVELVMTDFAFRPASFEVRAGVPVVLTLVNDGTVEHDFSILEIPVESVTAAAESTGEHDMRMSAMEIEPQLHASAAAGASNTLTFTPTKPGTYGFFCTVPGHKEAGMVGTLTVLAP